MEDIGFLLDIRGYYDGTNFYCWITNDYALASAERVNYQQTAGTTVSANKGASTLVTDGNGNLYRADAVCLVTTPGTLGAITVNVLFDDDLGSVTIPVLTTPSITGTSRTEGSYVFVANNGIQWSVGGITTGGALSAEIFLAITPIQQYL